MSNESFQYYQSTLLFGIFRYPIVVFDTSKPDGTPRKLLNVERLRALGWQAKILLQEGIRQVYAVFLLKTE